MRLRGSFALGLGFILLGGPGVPSCSGWPPGHTAGRIKEVGMAEPHSDRSWLQLPPPRSHVFEEVYTTNWTHYMGVSENRGP